MLTAKQILEKGIVFMGEGQPYKIAPAQMGIDLHVVSISKLVGTGFIPPDAYDENGDLIKIKTVIGSTEPVIAKEETFNGYPVRVWHLEPGVYEIGLAEGCAFDAKTCGKIVHRSSVYRNGSEINSPLWDPGFHTDLMGTFLYVKHPIDVSVGSRVAQMVVFESKEEAEEYDGQWQGTGKLDGKH